MSLVKRWSKSPIFNFQFAILLAVLLIGAGCENSDPVVNPGDTPNPNWVLTVENDLMSSMTVIVKVSFAEKEGILAAFIGDDCCGVTSSENYIDGRYNLFISPSEQGEDVQLKFYSPVPRNGPLRNSFTFSCVCQKKAVLLPRKMNFT